MAYLVLGEESSLRQDQVQAASGSRWARDRHPFPGTVGVEGCYWHIEEDKGRAMERIEGTGGVGLE